MINSDPYISDLRTQNLPRKKIYEVPEDMRDLIILPETSMETNEDHEYFNSDESDEDIFDQEELMKTDDPMEVSDEENIDDLFDI